MGNIQAGLRLRPCLKRPQTNKNNRKAGSLDTASPNHRAGGFVFLMKTLPPSPKGRRNFHVLQVYVLGARQILRARGVPAFAAALKVCFTCWIRNISAGA